MTESSARRIWKALVAVDEFLRHGLPQMIQKVAVLDPRDWKIIYDLRRVFQEEKLSIPQDVYDYFDGRVLTELQNNLNAVLDTLRQCLADREAANTSGKEFDEFSCINRVNHAFQVAHSNYTEHLKYLQQRLSKIEGEKMSKSGDRHINISGGNYNERIERDYIQGNYYAAGQPQSLAQAAAEIQLLLKQLEQTYPTTTTSQQMVVAAEAINRIESNPLLKERVINAVKSGGLAAFEKAIDNPAGAFIVGAIKGWQEVEAED